MFLSQPVFVLCLFVCPARNPEQNSRHANSPPALAYLTLLLCPRLPPPPIHTGFMARSATGAAVTAASSSTAAASSGGSGGAAASAPRIRPPQSAVAAAGFACQVCL